MELTPLRHLMRAANALGRLAKLLLVRSADDARRTHVRDMLIHNANVDRPEVLTSGTAVVVGEPPHALATVRMAVIRCTDDARFTEEAACMGHAAGPEATEGLSAGCAPRR